MRQLGRRLKMGGGGGKHVEVAAELCVARGSQARRGAARRGAARRVRLANSQWSSSAAACAQARRGRPQRGRRRARHRLPGRRRALASRRRSAQHRPSEGVVMGCIPVVNDRAWPGRAAASWARASQPPRAARRPTRWTGPSPRRSRSSSASAGWTGAPPATPEAAARQGSQQGPLWRVRLGCAPTGKLRSLGRSGTSAAAIALEDFSHSRLDQKRGGCRQRHRT